MESMSFADFLWDLLNDWGMLLRLGVVVLIAALASFGMFYLFRKVLHVAPASLQLSSTGANICFQSQSADKREFLCVVYPQRWQTWDIQVKAGEVVSFVAEGCINISLMNMFEAIRRRYKLERRYIGAGLVRRHSSTSKLPEDLYTDEERRKIVPERGWTGPQGYADCVQDHEYPPRTARKLLPTCPYGMLVGAINPISGDSPPDRNSSRFLAIGKGGTFQVHEPGQLWFTINDVWDDHDPLFPDKFYVDNFGSFLLKITITKA